MEERDQCETAAAHEPFSRSELHAQHSGLAPSHMRTEAAHRDWAHRSHSCTGTRKKIDCTPTASTRLLRPLWYLGVHVLLGYPNESSTSRRCAALCAEADLMSEPGLGGVLVVLEGFGDGSEVRPMLLRVLGFPIRTVRVVRVPADHRLRLV